ncbi:MAG: hypothetical protein WED10_14805 [Brumimicrobium sp.]
MKLTQRKQFFVEAYYLKFQDKIDSTAQIGKQNKRVKETNCFDCYKHIFLKLILPLKQLKDKKRI